MALWRPLLLLLTLLLTLGAGVVFRVIDPLGVNQRQSRTPTIGPRQNSGLPSHNDSCALRRRELSNRPALPGAPQVEAARAEIFARARSEAIVFLSAPAAEPRTPDVEQLRQRIYEEAYPWRAFADLLKRYRRFPKLLRQVLLTDGYLYAEKPTVAALLANNVVLYHLFNEPSLTIVRGSRTLTATRRGTEYYFSDGPEAGQLARLWLFDRVSPQGTTLGPPRLVSAGALGDETGASGVEIERLTSDGIVATLLYPATRIPAVLTMHQGELHVECEAQLSAADEAKVQAARQLAKRHGTVMARLREAIDQEVTEALPFDEPKTEEGQQDGKLRQEWKSAYHNGAYTYEFNGDKYSVFGHAGVPRIPQVCVDFVVDSWERMAGTRWLGLHEGRARQIGRIDFDKLDIENRRSVDRLIDFARARPEWFDVLEFAEGNRVRFQERQRFFQRLFEMRQDFRPGDVVAILGPRDDQKLHYHSFFIVAADPISGMPTQVAANAGRPRIRSWEAEMQNAPRRAIVARIRPRLAWLEQLTGIDPRGPVDLHATAIVSQTPDL